MASWALNFKKTRKIKLDESNRDLKTLLKQLECMKKSDNTTVNLNTLRLILQKFDANIRIRSSRFQTG